jgi:uncharacterized membrane protein (DUF485 family)
MALSEEDRKKLSKKNKRLAIVLGVVAFSFYFFFVVSHL